MIDGQILQLGGKIMKKNVCIVMAAMMAWMIAGCAQTESNNVNAGSETSRKQLMTCRKGLQKP